MNAIMPTPSPSLFVKRLLILRNGNFAYDRKFHVGINIIRGENGTGKSTIMDLMSYALGSEINDWTYEQKLCTATIIEVEISGHTFCLKRDIVESGKAPMFLFDGTSDDALVNVKDWLRYPYKRGSEIHSYSQQLFDMMGFPQHKTDDANNLTMHQIMRLIYVDQLTATEKLLNEGHQYDNETIRKAIGEFMLGLDDLEAYALRQQLIIANRSFAVAEAELRAIYRVLGSTDAVIRKQQLENEVSEAEQAIVELEKRKEEIRSAALDSLQKEVQEKIRSLRASLRELTVLRLETEEKREQQILELLDTRQFLDSLHSRHTSIQNSKVVSDELGAVDFKYCPACLAPLNQSDEEDSCRLCKKAYDHSSRHFGYIHMMNELSFQIRESTGLSERFQIEIDEMNLQLQDLDRKIRLEKDEYEELTANADLVDASLSLVATDIGYYRSQIETLNERKGFVDKIDALVDDKARLNNRIVRIKDLLDNLREKNKNREVDVYGGIEKIASELLQGDGYESWFENPESVLFNFAKDSMYVNERSRYSASSMVIMKNSIRAAMFLYSLGDDQTRIPRLFIMDNMEDKGMTPERSHNFQHMLVERCNEISGDFQFIFTTSMIDPDLDVPNYVIGPFYPKGEHTLEFV